MNPPTPPQRRIAVVGLGYVGLPVALADHLDRVQRWSTQAAPEGDAGQATGQLGG